MSGGAARFQARAGLLAVVGLIYASACGGPYGTEDYVVATGPGLFILLLVTAPWLWGVPMALATAELSVLRPVEGGYYRWAREFLGEFWGFQAATWSLISSFLDNALYPVLFASTLSYWFPGMTWPGRWLAAVAFIGLLTYLNYRGIQIVGRTAVGLNLFLIAPLVWIVVAGFARYSQNPFLPFTVPGAWSWEGLGSGLGLAIWFYSGYPEVSTACEEIERPEKTIPRALLIVTPLVILSYAAPTVAGLASVGGWQGWRSGEFARIGEALGGTALGQWAFLGSVASFTVIFMAYLLWWSRLGWTIASDHGLPFFARLHPRYGTPYRVLLLYALCYSILAALPFEDLLELDVWVFGAYDLLLVASVIAARRRATGPATGFRIPGGSRGVWMVALVPAATWVLFLACTAGNRIALFGWDVSIAIVGTGLLASGPILYGVLRAVWRRSAPGVPS